MKVSINWCHAAGLPLYRGCSEADRHGPDLRRNRRGVPRQHVCQADRFQFAADHVRNLGQHIFLGRTPTSSSLLSTDQGAPPFSELFFTELTNVFDVLATFNHHVIITGDFNIKVNDGDDKNSRKLAELLQSCGFVQSVVGPTHTHGNTLDLVITRSDLSSPG